MTVEVAEKSWRENHGMTVFGSGCPSLTLIFLFC